MQAVVVNGALGQVLPVHRDAAGQDQALHPAKARRLYQMIGAGNVDFEGAPGVALAGHGEHAPQMKHRVRLVGAQGVDHHREVGHGGPHKGIDFGIGRQVRRRRL